MATLKYANPTSGPSAGAIGWIDWGDFVLAPGDTINNVTLTLLDDATMTFDITNTILSGDGFTFTSTSTPIFPGAPFGTLGYTDIDGKVALEPFMDYVISGNSSRITLSNIAVSEDSIPVVNFSLVGANIETENCHSDPLSEFQVYRSTLSTWNSLTWLGSALSPEVTGMLTNNSTMVGIHNTSGSPVIYCDKTDTFHIDISSQTGFQAVAIGITITSIRLRTYITKRIHPSDQFVLSISGIPDYSVTTTGSATGLQSEVAFVDGYAGYTYTINETMASGSSSLLSDYNQVVVWTRINPNGTIPPTPGTLGDSLMLALGDVFICDIVNVPKTPTRGINLFNFKK